MTSENSTRTMRSASTTIASTKSLSFPRDPVSAMTAALIVGEKLTTMTTSSAMIASFAVPVASGAIGSHGHTSHANTAKPDIAIASVIDGGDARSGHTPLETLDVERQPGDERDERRRDTGDELKLSRHPLGDHVAEIGSDEQSEQQIAGQARQPESPKKLSRHERDDQREAERERRAARIV